MVNIKSVTLWFQLSWSLWKINWTFFYRFLVLQPTPATHLPHGRRLARGYLFALFFSVCFLGLKLPGGGTWGGGGCGRIVFTSATGGQKARAGLHGNRVIWRGRHASHSNFWPAAEKWPSVGLWRGSKTVRSIFNCFVYDWESHSELRVAFSIGVLPLIQSTGFQSRLCEWNIEY